METNVIVRCKTCYYLLENLTEHRCPECGSAFDPNDPSTYKSRERFFTHWMSLITGLSALLIFLVARSAFYQPDPADPNNGEGLMATVLGFFIAVLLMPVVMLAIVAIRAWQLRR